MALQQSGAEVCGVQQLPGGAAFQNVEVSYPIAMCSRRLPTPSLNAHAAPEVTGGRTALLRAAVAVPSLKTTSPNSICPMHEPLAEPHGPSGYDWAGLHSPLLQRCFLLALGKQTFQFAHYLRGDSAEGAACREEQAALAALACVCRRWRQQLEHLLEHGITWSVTVQRCPPTRPEFPDELGRKAVAELDLRWLTWQDMSATGCSAWLLISDRFRWRSGACLRAALGIAEALAPSLAAFGRLEAVGLMEDYVSAAGKAHGAQMELAPLRGLQHLRRLQLERGIVDLAALPPPVQELVLFEVDRLMVPPAPGASIADRLLAAAEAHGALRSCIHWIAAS